MILMFNALLKFRLLETVIWSFFLKLKKLLLSSSNYGWIMKRPIAPFGFYFSILILHVADVPSFTGSTHPSGAPAFIIFLVEVNVLN